jgi:magnesium chelatase family protein
LTRPELDALDWDPDASRLLHRAVERFSVTGRGYDRIRRVARTIADLAGAGGVTEAHAAEALGLRSGS